MIKARLLFIGLFFSMLHLYGQEKQATSLEVLEDASSPPFNRIIKYTDFIWENLMFSDPDSAYTLLQEAEKFALQNDATQGLAYIYNQIGVSHGIRGNLAEASSAFRISTEKLLEVKDYPMYVSVMENLAHSYEQGGLLSKAINTLKKSEAFAEIHRVEYSKDYVNEVYGTIYLSQGNLQAAKSRFFKAIELYAYEKDSIDIGTNYKYLGDLYQKENNLDSALYFYQKSLEIHQHLSKSNACQTALSMGKLFFKKGHLEAAKTYLHQTLSTATELSLRDESTGAYILNGQIAIREENLLDAISNFEQALKIAQAGNHLINQEHCHRELYQLNKRLGNSPKALSYLEESKILSDSIKGDEVKKQLQLLDFRNQIRQDSIQIENVIETDRLKYQASLRSRNNIVILLLGIALGLLVFAYFLFKAKREKEGLLTEVQEQHQKVTQMNEEIIRTKDQLVVQEKLASLGQLTAGIAHEIKNPLNFITNFSEDSAELIDELDESLIKVKNLFPSEKHELIQSNIDDLKLNLSDIKNNGLRIDQIVNNMMNHARGTESMQNLEDINQLVDINTNFAYKGFKAINRTFMANIIKNLDPHLPSVKIYPQELGRVILNLVNNACYATQIKQQAQNDFTPQIKISTALEEDQLKIMVADNGIGIPKEVQGDIFNPFFTTKPTGESNIGLGLSISYDIITQLHKGQIEVDSIVDQQTTFTISIPIQ